MADPHDPGDHLGIDGECLCEGTCCTTGGKNQEVCICPDCNESACGLPHAPKEPRAASEPPEDAIVRWGNGAFFTRCPSGWIGWGTTAELLGPGPWPWLHLSTFMTEHYGPHALLVKQAAASEQGESRG